MSFFRAGSSGVTLTLKVQPKASRDAVEGAVETPDGWALKTDGLAQGFYTLRDGLLRWIAERRQIVVPSLVADVQVEAESTVLENGSTERTPRRLAKAVVCPVCGEAIPVAEVTAHEHFEPVPSS